MTISELDKVVDGFQITVRPNKIVHVECRSCPRTWSTLPNSPAPALTLALLNHAVGHQKKAAAS